MPVKSGIHESRGIVSVDGVFPSFSGGYVGELRGRIPFKQQSFAGFQLFLPKEFLNRVSSGQVGPPTTCGGWVTTRGSW